MKKKRKSDIEKFISLPDSEKARIADAIENESFMESIARSRPLNKQEKKQWRRFKSKGRPKIGQGAKIISLTVEKGLLKQADAYAKRHKISRAKLFAEGLHAIMESAA